MPECRMLPIRYMLTSGKLSSGKNTGKIFFIPEMASESCLPEKLQENTLYIGNKKKSRAEHKERVQRTSAAFD